MMTLWSIFRSPLMIGGEMTGFDEFTMRLITNEEILAMHRNSRNAHQVWRREVCGSEYILWTASSAAGGRYVAIFNAGEKDGEIEIPLSEIEIYDKVSGRELWNGEEFLSSDKIAVKVPSHGAKAYLIL